MPKPPCESTISPHHSKDRVEVYHGSPTPTILCGYHNLRRMLAADAKR